MQKNTSAAKHLFAPAYRFLPFVITIVIGSLVSFIFFAIVGIWEHEKQRIEFESRSMGYANAVQSSIHDYVEAIRFVGDFINNSEEVTRGEFSRFVLSAIDRNPGIQAFSWNPLVQDSERPEYEARARAAGIEGFMFTERAGDKKELVRAGRREEYVVVYFIEPLEKNKSAIGYDIASEATRLKAINRAFDTGNLSSTDRITLVQETGEQFGILILFPIYNQRVLLRTAEERRRQRKGVVVEVLRIGDVVEGALKDFSDEGIDMYLYDLSADEAHQFLYVRPSNNLGKMIEPGERGDIQEGLHWSRNFDFAGRQWQMLFSPSSQYLDSLKSWQALVVLTGSLLLTFLLSFYLKKKSVYTVEIEEQVKKQRETNRNLEKEIAERKKLEAQLVQAQKMEAIGELAGGIAHDFNNILSAIMNNIYLSKMYMEPESKAYKQLVTTEKAVTKAAGLTQRLVTFAKGGAPVKKTLSLAKLIRESAEFALSGSNVSCEVTIADNLWLVDADEGQINRVIHNLVANADQSMPEGGKILIRAENSIVSSGEGLPLGEGRYIKIVLHDQGQGIPEDHLLKIFDPYFTTKEKGSGLGLSVSYSIIKNHNGYISVESEVGAGSTFTLYLPASEKDVAGEEHHQESIIPGEGRVLIMDDEEMVRCSLGEMLSVSGYEIAYAEDGKEAIDLYQDAMGSSRPFDAVIMDLTVPGGMGGKEAIRLLREADPEIRAVVSSGYSDDPVMAHFREYGFSAVLPKPCSPGQISSLLHRLLKSPAK